MKTILIIGDSWGVPNYNSNFDCPPEIHTSNRLKKLGYNVINCSLNASSMLLTIEYAKALIQKKLNSFILKVDLNFSRRTFVEKTTDVYEVELATYNNETIDWILWFHTEPIRNMDQTKICMQYCTIEEAHLASAHLGYRAFKSLYDLCPKAKTAIIGGQCPVDPLLFTYHKPNFIIEDWRSEIVGEKLPLCITTARINYVEESNDTTENKLKHLDTIKIIQDVMRKDPNLFFDHCHPGRIPHEQLTNKLHEIFQKE